MVNHEPLVRRTDAHEPEADASRLGFSTTRAGGINVLNYASPKRRRLSRSYQWILLAMLVMLVIYASVYAWLHWNDLKFWDI
jgi:hypothetical protein